MHGHFFRLCIAQLFALLNKSIKNMSVDSVIFQLRKIVILISISCSLYFLTITNVIIMKKKDQEGKEANQNNVIIAIYLGLLMALIIETSSKVSWTWTVFEYNFQRDVRVFIEAYNDYWEYNADCEYLKNKFVNEITPKSNLQRNIDEVLKSCPRLDANFKHIRKLLRTGTRIMPRYAIFDIGHQNCTFHNRFKLENNDYLCFIAISRPN